MNETNETTIGADWLLADRVLRDVIGGETGDLVRAHVESAIGDMRRELRLDLDGFDAERFAWEQANHEAGNLFPYTYDMAQAWAESIHHVTFELEGELHSVETPFDAIAAQMEAIVRRALELVEELAEELEGCECDGETGDACSVCGRRLDA